MKSAPFRAIPLLAALAAALPAAADSLNVDGLPTGMANSSGTTVPAANRLSNQFLSQGVLVSSDGGFAAVVLDSGSGTDWARNTAGVRQGLGGSTAAGKLSFTAPITFTFVDRSDGTTPYVTDAFSLYTDWYGVGSVVSITAYDVLGNIVAQDSHAEQNGRLDFGTPYSVAAAGIHSVVFRGAGTQAISNIHFDPPVAPVPEPASLAALGLGALGVLGRRSRERR